MRGRQSPAPHREFCLLLAQLAADRAGRERRGVVVDVVSARVRAEVGPGRARIWGRHAALLDVASARRRSGRHKQGHDDRAGDSSRGPVDVAGDESLVVLVENSSLELDRAIVANLDQRVALAVEVEPVVSFAAASFACRTHITP
jgi:hypothetical protein